MELVVVRKDNEHTLKPVKLPAAEMLTRGIPLMLNSAPLIPLPPMLAHV
jgi:hypothetical protein